jgi:ribA/ribD-fused uncharacterized protein
MVPPWVKYPEILRYSIGWRMGYGESYIIDFNEWYEKLSSEEKGIYKKMFPPQEKWKDYYNEETEESEDTKELDIDYNFWDGNHKIKYSVQDLKKDYVSEKRNEILFFWGHKKSDDGSITKSVFSQWWMSDFTVDIEKYNCMEQYMMAEKARTFKDDEILNMIMKSTSPRDIKAFGRKVKNYNDEIWTKKRYMTVLDGNYAKFSQNEDLKKFLMATENKVIVEASPYDKIWGIGMSVNNEEINNPLKWRGKNLLGFALMEVRDELIKTFQNENIKGFDDYKDK